MESLEHINLIPATTETREARESSAGSLFKNLGNYLWHPGRYFEALKQRPSWFHLYLASALCAACLSYLNFPFLREVFVVTLRAQAPVDKIGPALANFDRGRLLGLLLTPVLLLVKLALQAVLLAIIAATITSRATFRSAFVIIINLQPFVVLQGFQSLGLLYYFGVDAIRTSADMQSRIGLDVFAGSSVSLPVLTVLHAINLFEGLWLCYLYIGLRRMLTCSRTSSVMIVSIYWVVTVGLSVAIAVLSLDPNSVGT